MSYKPTIGLEIHAELGTNSKLFCGCANDSEEEEPNVNICPICMAHPGTLPTLNKEAVKKIILIGLALNGKIARETNFDRKHYFYPDIPKGYQISQYDDPLVSGGELAGVKITRIHLEEDTARSNHELLVGSTLVDFNRAGVPLMELVTEPVIHNAEKALEFAKELQLLLKTLGVSNARMEQGEMRVEANISISKSDKLGGKVEVKNLNSFKSLVRAIEFEIKRQEECLERGEAIPQETRGWNENTEKTFSQRTKESAVEYRYIPDPDLTQLMVYEDDELNPDSLLKTLPELPTKKRERYLGFGLSEKEVGVLVENAYISELFDSTISNFIDDKKKIKFTANYLLSDIMSYYKKNSELKITSESLAELVNMIADGKISSRGAKDTIAVLVVSGGGALEVAESRGFLQESDMSKLGELVSKIINDNPKVVAEYREEGKESVLQFFVGQAMKETKGSANPQILQKLFKEKLG
ncbi:MAG: Asp-tRNA(Asn)/Glu-tRNA(Gln) amidotransferase subunit GatB [Candidatus Campbellbacteria bacterium]|nr:Asp-tRNA(Asn)/Glu-tRNA(Gln) amidotransferase subunit GatB [Candidatus Campbellbacteria bacterium]